MANNRTIILKSYNNNRIELKHDDGANSIYPGQMVEDKADGTCELNTAVLDNIADNVPTMIVTENNLAGREVTDAYKVNNRVSIWMPGPGDVGLVRMAANVAVVFGMKLTPDAAGNFIATPAGSVPKAVAIEAVAAPGAGNHTLAKVRFL